MSLYDVIVIGGGVVGCAIARELSRYRLRIGVVDKEPDVGLGTSCRNSGVVHSGVNYRPGTLRASLSVRGNSMMDELCRSLKVPLRRTGKLTVATTMEDLSGVDRLREQGEANGVPGMAILDNAAMRRIQPGIEGVRGLWTPSSGIVSPYGLTIALAENACANGVHFHLGHCVTEIGRGGEGFFVVEAAVERPPQSNARVGQAVFSTRVVVNSAGLNSGEISRGLGIDSTRIWPCRGEYHVLDKRLAGCLSTLVYPVPGPNDPGLGIHFTPTVDGNILIGPSATYLPVSEKEDYRTTRNIMEELRREGVRLLPELCAADFIRSFAGNRPKQTPPEIGGNADFTIEDTAIPGFIRLQGIESPGLTSSPAIAVLVRDMVARHLELRERDDFIAGRPGLVGHFSGLSRERQMEMIRCQPEYGEIVCRCEHVTKKEIRDAIENPLGAWSLMAIKYRTRAMMGRCQGGFCLSRIAALLRAEYGYRSEDIRLRGGLSQLFTGMVRPD